MFHLFSKIYLENDSNIDPSYNRVVISQTNGVPLLGDLNKVFSGELIAYGKNLDSVTNVSSFLDLLTLLEQKSNQSDKIIYIYADTENYYKILATWLKIILPSATVEDVSKYVNTYFVYKKFWQVARMTTQITSNLDFNKTKFENYYNSISINKNDYTDFINNNVENFNIELLLSSYLSKGTRKEELKVQLTYFLKIEFTKMLYEAKEILMYNLLNPSYLSNLGVTETYTIDNFQDVIKNSNPIIQTMFNSNIWKNLSLSGTTLTNLKNLNENDIEERIDYANITDQDLENIKQVILQSSTYDNKINSIKLFKNGNISDSDLSSLLELQSEQNTIDSSGTFYSVNSPTINSYFIQHIFNLYKNNNLQDLESYAV
jgi:hypothetical protein